MIGESIETDLNPLTFLRSRNESGGISRPEFSRLAWNHHRRLFDYPDYLRDTNVRSIEITEDGLIATLRSPSIRLWMTPLDRGQIAISNLNYRQYERNEVEMLLSLASDLEGSITFFDIGANEGLYSIEFAKRFPKSMVYAFEPIPEMQKVLCRNLDANGVGFPGTRNVVMCPFGISDENNDYAEFHVSPLNYGATSLAPLEEERFGKTLNVRACTRTLDSVVTSRLVDWSTPNVIKCDVEGAELLVLRGAEKTLNQSHPIIQCEMLRKWAKRFDYHPNELIAYLAQFGYQCYTLRDNKLVPFPVMTDETVETNFYFLTEAHKNRMP